MKASELRAIDRINTLVAEASAISDIVATRSMDGLDQETVPTLAGMVYVRMRELREVIPRLQNSLAVSPEKVE